MRRRAVSSCAPASAPRAVVRAGLWVILTLGVVARLALLGRDLPYYSVDENEIVEQAYVFLSGDLCPSFYSYGPLIAYLLAASYGAGWLLLDLVGEWSCAEFFHRAIFQPTPFYTAARALHAAADVAALAVASRLAARGAAAPAGWAVLAIGSAPLLSLNTDFTIRNDTFQGLFALAALGFAGRAGSSPRRSAALSGAAAGLSLAVKPLQGLLVLPALTIGLVAPPLIEWRSAGRRALTVPLTTLATFAAALIAVHTAVNPCSVTHFAELWKDNVFWVGTASPSTAPGWQFGWWVQVAGWPLALFVAPATALAGFVARDTTQRLLLLYVLTVVGAYLFVGVRPYWYNAILPAVLVLAGTSTGWLAVRVAAKRGWRAADVAIVAGALLAAVPMGASAREAWRAWRPQPSLERRTDRAAQLWIEEHVPPGSHLLAVGRYALGMPRLVAETPKVHGVWADLFMYGRGSSRSWNVAFRAAYRRHRHHGAPLYWITNVRRDYTDRWPDPVVVRRMHEVLPALARQAGARYIVTSSSSGFEGRWERAPGVRLLARFTPERLSETQTEIKVLELAPPEGRPLTIAPSGALDGGRD